MAPKNSLPFATLLLLRRGPLAPEFDTIALGQANPPLAASAAELEAAAVRRLAERQPSVVLGSDLLRAQRTADALATLAGVPLFVRRELREQHLGRFQGRPWPEIVRDETAAAVAFLDSFATATPPDGESLASVRERVVKAVTTTVRRHHRGVVACVTHAGPIRALLSHFLGLGLAATLRFQLDPFGLTILELQGATATLVRLNG